GGSDDRAATAAGATTTAAAMPAGGVTVRDNCGVDVHVDAPPRRAVSMNQPATEIMLALGLQDRMIGTASLDDAVLPRFAAAYRSVPVLAKAYPSHERLLAASPDFVYGSYSSVFEEDAAGDRAELEQLGAASYLSPMGCKDEKQRPAPVGFDDVFAEIAQIGELFGVRDRADAVVAGLRDELRAAVADGRPGAGTKVLWFDSDTKSPYVGACCGAPALIMRTVGAENAFADLRDGTTWGNVSWEQVVARDPDVIVLVDASWDTAASKRKFLLSDPATKKLRAVRERRFVTIPFSDSSAGLRNVEGVKRLAAGLRELDAQGS
ncbi:ABC transporter substrate-binding protein, partial [Patulibacter sp. S7RM1-6]